MLWIIVAFEAGFFDKNEKSVRAFSRGIVQEKSEKCKKLTYL